jgi:hypothetical protein
MPERSGSPAPRVTGVRDRRYTLRFPFAADAEICTSKPLPIGTRGRLTLTRRGQSLEALVVVRIVKPRIGMGIEFFDVEPPHNDTLAAWLETLRRAR